MHIAIAERRADLVALCRRHGVVRLEVFGSAARSIWSSARRSRRAATTSAAAGSLPKPRRFMVEPVAGSDAALLLDMWLAARDARTFLEGLDQAAFLASRLHQNAVIRSLEVIGEAAGKVSSATQAAHADIPWRDITGMRHRLIHGYAEVRLDLVWTVAQERLGPLIAALALLIPDEGAHEG